MQYSGHLFPFLAAPHKSYRSHRSHVFTPAACPPLEGGQVGQVGQGGTTRPFWTAPRLILDTGHAARCRGRHPCARPLAPCFRYSPVTSHQSRSGHSGHPLSIFWTSQPNPIIPILCLPAHVTFWTFWTYPVRNRFARVSDAWLRITLRKYPAAAGSFWTSWT